MVVAGEDAGSRVPRVRQGLDHALTGPSTGSPGNAGLYSKNAWKAYRIFQSRVKTAPSETSSRFLLSSHRHLLPLGGRPVSPPHATRGAVRSALLCGTALRTAERVGKAPRSKSPGSVPRAVH